MSQFSWLQQTSMLILSVNGREFHLDGFHCGATYGGLLEGSPTTRVNERLKAAALEVASRLWGPRKVWERTVTAHDLIVGTPRENSEWLPAIQCYAWLHSAPLDPKYDGSELVIVWYQRELPTSVTDAVASVLREVPWGVEAQDYDL